MDGVAELKENETSAITIALGSHDKPEPEVKVSIETQRHQMIYGVTDKPSIPITLFFGIQQALLSLSLNLTVALLVAEAVCAGNDEILKTKILSTTLFISGICTILMVTIGVRLPIFQGPGTTFVVPLASLHTLPEWNCNIVAAVNNVTNINSTAISTNETSGTQTDIDVVLYRIQMMQGSLIVAGLIQTFLGMTGLVGKLLRYIGPITVVPVVTLIGFSIYRTAVKFCETQWGVSFFTLICGLVLSLYLGNNKTPIPFWSRKKGFHILRYPLHQVFSLLFAIIIGWIVSFILTETGALSDDPKSKQFLARTDSKTWVLRDSPWFNFPYPGQFGPPSFSIDVFVTFLIATLVSVIDSIGDYYACARICKVPPPPSHAVNRGILVEGFMSVVAGTLGIAHATNSYGPNLGALGVTKVASIRVFITVGIMYIAFGVFGKFGAFFITIPYSVLGGVTIISFGIFIGVNLSNMIYIDLHSTRNLSIIGISMLLGLMIPYWTQENPEGIKTGVLMIDMVIKAFLGNPIFPGGIVAFVLDNTIPGTVKERGLTGWLTDLEKPDMDITNFKDINLYNFPYINNRRFHGKILRRIPFLPGYKPKLHIDF